MGKIWPKINMSINKCLINTSVWLIDIHINYFVIQENFL